ncbi:hypothetical protein FOFC_10857 [Fusarium oxysporum]|nr:hypothetical protein FOFC_10857 [Fusarium oxysporum]
MLRGGGTLPPSPRLLLSDRRRTKPLLLALRSCLVPPSGPLQVKGKQRRWRRTQSRNKDIRGKRNKGDSNVSRDRGRSTNRTSSKVSSRRTNANNDSDNDSDSDSKTTDNGHAKSEGREKATNDKTQKSQQAGTPRHSNGTKSTPKVKASTRTPSVENTPSAALRTKSASRAPIGTPSNALLTTTPTSSTQHLNKRAGHSRPDSGREKAGPSFKPQGYKKRKLSQGSAKG